jgi:rhamnosyltransferase
MSRDATVSVVIPTRNAAVWLPALLDRLADQAPVPPQEVILVDSSSRDGTRELAAARPEVRLLTVERFTHGGARNLGIRAATGECIALLTQDALPADEHWLARLLEPLADPEVAGVYARQIPRPDADPLERFFLADRFPNLRAPAVRRHEGREPPVYPKTFFSNVSSALRRSDALAYPFDESLLMGEDQQYARDVLMAGRTLVYQPTARVWHSHAYSPWQTVKRYFDSTVAFRQLSAQHGVTTSAALGLATLRREAGFVRRAAPLWLPQYALYTLARAAGVLASHVESILPRGVCARLSLQPDW